MRGQVHDSVSSRPVWLRFSVASLFTFTLATAMTIAGYDRFRWYALEFRSYVAGVMVFAIGGVVGWIMGCEPTPRWTMLVVSLVLFICIVNGTIADRGDGVVLWALSCAAAGIALGTTMSMGRAGPTEQSPSSSG